MLKVRCPCSDHVAFYNYLTTSRYFISFFNPWIPAGHRSWIEYYYSVTIVITIILSCLECTRLLISRTFTMHTHKLMGCHFDKSLTLFYPRTFLANAAISLS